MVIAYLRATVDKQGFEVQREVITRYAEAHNLEIDKWITEMSDGKRKGSSSSLTHIIDKMKEGDKMLVSDISRFGRTLAEVMTYLGRCMALGVWVYCIKDRYLLDSTFNMKAISDACNMVVNIEHNLMSTRTKEALNHKRAKDGLQLGRPKGTDAKQSLLEANKDEVMDMIERGDTVVMICQHFKVSRNTYYQFKKNYGL